MSLPRFAEDELLAAVENYLETRGPVYKSMRVGSPLSIARSQQDEEIAAESRLHRAILNFKQQRPNPPELEISQ
jgi:hypothetical protein